MAGLLKLLNVGLGTGGEPLHLEVGIQLFLDGGGGRAGCAVGRSLHLQIGDGLIAMVGLGHHLVHKCRHVLCLVGKVGCVVETDGVGDSPCAVLPLLSTDHLLLHLLTASVRGTRAKLTHRI